MTSLLYRRAWYLLPFLFSYVAGAQLAAPPSLPVLPHAQQTKPAKDWLLAGPPQQTRIYRSADGKEITLSNGLIQRTWRVTPDGATVGFANLMTGESILRGVKPEANVELDGRRFDVGGLLGQPDYAYLRPEWLNAMTASPHALHLLRVETGSTEAPFAWQRVRYAENRPWPPPGRSLTLHFAGPSNSIDVAVHYEMYDGIPLLAKWLTIVNQSGRTIVLQHFVSEFLAVADRESRVEHIPRPPDVMHVESDYEFGGMDPEGANQTTAWVPDPQYTTQVNYDLKSPVLLESRPPIGPDLSIEAGQSWKSFRTYELVYDSTGRERRGLALRRMYRTVAPWVTENPIFMHVRKADLASVKLAVDQCADTGFEMVIMTFGSGFNIENADPAYLTQMKQLAAYARSRHVELGGYSLLASRSIDAADDAINPKTGKPGGAIYGDSPCLRSRWGEEYFQKVKHFVEATGISVFENDGSYPGDLCASTKHPGHKGLEDSQWTQWQQIADFYRWCRGRGVYLNVPDWYFLNGSNKAGMGYREVNWSLPRDRQLILARQNIYDGTWHKTPSMGWMFVPLTQYHGGGAAATIEPLKDHLEDYARRLSQNFGAGVQAIYRGPRLFDSPETMSVVKKWVSFYKAHRDILDSDIVHVRRPDGSDIDAILHVNPALQEKGMAMIYNPLDHAVTGKVELPLYYTGLTHSARVRSMDGAVKSYSLDREFNISVAVTVPSHGMSWLVIE